MDLGDRKQRLYQLCHLPVYPYLFLNTYDDDFLAKITVYDIIEFRLIRSDGFNEKHEQPFLTYFASMDFVYICKLMYKNKNICRMKRVN